MSIISGIAVLILTFFVPMAAFYLGLHLGESDKKDGWYGLPAAMNIIGIAFTLMLVIFRY